MHSNRKSIARVVPAQKRVLDIAAPIQLPILLTGIVSFVLLAVLTVFPWVSLLGQDYRGLSGEGRLIVVVCVGLLILLCVFSDEPHRTRTLAAAGAWGSMTFLWLTLVAWRLVNGANPVGHFQPTFIFYLCIPLALTAGGAFTYLVRQHHKTLLIAYAATFWLVANLAIIEPTALSLRLQIDSDLIYPANAEPKE